MEAVNIFYWIECVLIAAAVAVAIILVPRRFPKVALTIGRFISPNLLSILHVPIALVGYFYFYLNGHLMTCALLLGISAAMDSLDGRMAAVLDTYLKLPKPQTFWKSLFHRGGTELGQSIDPAMDKAAIMPIYIHIAYVYICHMLTDGVDMADKVCYLLSASFIACAILTDLMGTIIRFDYFKRKGWIKNGKAATWAGKSKTIAQWLWFILYPAQDMEWVTESAFLYNLILTLFLLIIMILAVISLLSKMFTLKKEWTKAFEHSVE